jgi:hypothetical protein
MKGRTDRWFPSLSHVSAPIHHSTSAGVAQLVEQLIRNQQVWGSSPHAGSTFHYPAMRFEISLFYRFSPFGIFFILTKSDG